MRKIVISILKFLLLLTIFNIIPLSAFGVEKIRWKVQHMNFGPLKKGVEDFRDKIIVLSEGNINLRLYGPNSRVPNNQIYEAVASGQLDGGILSALYLLDKYPELSVFSAIPFGPSPVEYTAWIRYGGGQELKDDIYEKMNLKALQCSVSSPEAGGWFRERYKSVNELKGVKMRILGLGAKVMEKIGVKTQLLSGKDVRNAFKRKEIDAYEFGPPRMDEYFKLNLTEYYYFPGWQQQMSNADFVINLNKWNKLSNVAKSIIKTTCNEWYFNSYVKGNAAQISPIINFKKNGVKLIRWSELDLNKIRKAWEEVAYEISNENPLFKKTYSSLQNFRKKYALWSDNAFLR